MNFLVDSLRSFVSGLGDPARDKLASTEYTDIILDDLQLMTLYRNSWIVKKLVNIPANDSFRKGRDWSATEEQITAIEEEERRLGLWRKLVQCKQMARLWGGAGIVIGIKGQDDLSEPLDLEKIGKGDLAYLTVLTRKQLLASSLEQDPYSEFFGRPAAYKLSATNDSDKDIHPSRVLVMIGSPHPEPELQTGQNLGWGDSVVQAAFTSARSTDATQANIASLVFEANVDVFRLPGFMDSLSEKSYAKKVLDRLSLASAGKSVSKSLVMDKEEEYDRKQVNFGSLPDVLQTFLLIVSGAADIPLTRFLGQSPSGLSSTGEGDMKNYYDQVQTIQTLEIQPDMWRLDEAIIRSALGSRPPEIFYNWTPLEQISEKDQAEIGLKNAQTTETLSRTGLFSQEELRNATANQLIENGIYPGLAKIMAEGDWDPDYDLGEDEPDPKGKELETDAKPLSLYMRRDVLNADEIIAHYKAQGVKKIYEPESMHVTIVYSKTPIDWMKMGQPWDSQIELPAGGPRLNEKFGHDESVLALLFRSHDLEYRHERSDEIGASYDFEEYQPHISITLEGTDLDLSKIEPYQGKIVLGPEIYEEIDTSVDWKEKVKAGDANVQSQKPSDK